MKNKQQLILIGYEDDDNLNRLEKVLRRNGAEVLRLNFGGQVADYVIDWALDKGPVLDYRGTLFTPATFKTCGLVFVHWWRMDTPALVNYCCSNTWYQDFTRREWEATFKNALLCFKHVNERVWVGDTLNTNNSNLKIYYLSVAVAIGFTIPECIISNEHKNVPLPIAWVAKAINKNQSIAPGEEFYTASVSPAVLTDRINNARLEAPALLQVLVDKSFEVRVFYISGELIAVKIQVPADSIDSRMAGTLQTEPFELSDDLQQQVMELAQALDMSYFAIDLLFDREEKAWLVDITPEGSWFYYETDELEITRQIAQVFIKKCML